MVTEHSSIYLTRAKFHFIARNWIDARTETEKALTIYKSEMWL